MNLLFDTHAFIWYFMPDGKLSDKARNALSDEHNVKYLSSACVWEAVIKRSLGKLELPLGLDLMLRRAREHDCQELPVLWEHAQALQELAPVHADPFDRILAAQAKNEKMTIVSSDRIFDEYHINRIW